jgi:hypothetical protein
MSPSVPVPEDYEELKYKFDLMYYQKQYSECLDYCLAVMLPFANSPSKRKDAVDAIVRCCMHSQQYSKALEWIEERV